MKFVTVVAMYVEMTVMKMLLLLLLKLSVREALERGL
jgi:hypothetical protein